MRVILVDQNDNTIGTEEKLKAHETGKLHRAFSVFIFNKSNELLLQKRALSKYHSPGLWTNSCCSHPSTNDIKEDAKKRLWQEMRIQTELEKRFSFVYKSEFDNGLTEHEYDHVFFGYYDGDPNPNPDEVSGWKWMPLEKLRLDIKKTPQKYTTWLNICLEHVIAEKNTTLPRCHGDAPAAPFA